MLPALLSTLLASVAGASTGRAEATPAPTSPPRITGTPRQGALLRAVPGSWSGGPVAFAFQWRSCDATGSSCVDVPSATDSIYAIRPTDVARTLRLSITARNASGTTTAVAPPTAAIAPAPAGVPLNAARPTVTGRVRKGEQVSAQPGTWSGADPIRFTYDWRRCDPTGGACQDTSRHDQTYRPRGEDVGHALRVLVTARNVKGTSVALGDPTQPVAPASNVVPGVVPANKVLPSVAGTVVVGRTLAGSRGQWSPVPTRFEYSWLRCDKSGDDCDVVGGARSSTYVLTAADAGHTIRFRVRAASSGGARTAVSEATAVVRSAEKPANTAPPTVSGSPQEGQTLTGHRGEWANGPRDFDYRWLRCDRTGGTCAAIVGATATTYRLTHADVGATVRFRVTAKNENGATTAASVPTAVVAGVAPSRPVNTVPPTISGTPRQGTILSGSRGAWGNGPTRFGYAWLRCDRSGGSCAAIAGATGTSYSITSADVGNTLRFRVQASNAGGSTTATSVPTAVVAAAAPPSPPRPSGCPASGHPDQAAKLAPPARLLVDALTSSPRVVTAATRTLVVRFHVASTCGGPVQGALVYATATPYNQFTIPPEALTGNDGWAELRFRRLSGFPVSRRQQLIAMFVRARKPGDDPLAGISTRRLISIRVQLHR